MKWEYEFGKALAKNFPVVYRCPFPGMTALLLGTIGTLLLLTFHGFSENTIK